MEMIVKFHIINQSKMGHLWWHAYHWDSFMGVSHLVPSSPTPPRSWLVFEDSQFVDKIQPPKGWPGLLKPSTSTGSWASGTTKSALRWIPTIYIYYNILYYIYMRYSYEPYNIYIHTPSTSMLNPLEYALRSDFAPFMCCWSHVLVQQSPCFMMKTTIISSGKSASARRRNSQSDLCLLKPVGLSDDIPQVHRWTIKFPFFTAINSGKKHFRTLLSIICVD